ncbi:MAG: hypothetical protein NTU57_05580 [Candidatus Aenigmarchaeota archaeon]|nr:hypothetical protein [Candidatus Aenigmarchaeota archaeon]
MKKVHAVAIPLVIIAIFAVVIFFTPLFIFHAVSTDKSVYSPGEKVLIASSDFGFGMYCTCQNPQLEIYRFADEKWEKIPHNPPLGIYQCVNETLYHSSAMMCDTIFCQTKVVEERFEYGWYAQIFRGEERTCGNKTYTYYDKVDAQKGTYKAKYGMAEAVFEII